MMREEVAFGGPGDAQQDTGAPYGTADGGAFDVRRARLVLGALDECDEVVDDHGRRDLSEPRRQVAVRRPKDIARARCAPGRDEVPERIAGAERVPPAGGGGGAGGASRGPREAAVEPEPAGWRAAVQHVALVASERAQGAQHLAHV